jgi:hypothetical protein
MPVRRTLRKGSALALVRPRVAGPSEAMRGRGPGMHEPSAATLISSSYQAVVIASTASCSATSRGHRRRSHVCYRGRVARLHGPHCFICDRAGQLTAALVTLHDSRPSSRLVANSPLAAVKALLRQLLRSRRGPVG